MRGGGCFATVFNFLTAMVVLAIVAAVALLAALLYLPGAGDAVAGLLPASVMGATEPVPPTQVAVAVVPTPEPTATPSSLDLLQPTWTPPAGGPAPQTTPTNTRRPPVNPSITPTLPPSTPTPSATPTATGTATPGPIGTATATRSAFPFTKSIDSPIYLTNFANNAGCDWMGIAGQVLDLNRNPVTAGSYRVHVWGSGIDERVIVGSAEEGYGASGWEQFVLDHPAVRDYNIQLESPEGTAVSMIYAVQTRASCDENLLYFIFEQNH